MHWIPNTVGIRSLGFRTRFPSTTRVCGAEPTWLHRIDCDISILVCDLAFVSPSFSQNRFQENPTMRDSIEVSRD